MRAESIGDGSSLNCAEDHTHKTLDNATVSSSLLFSVTTPSRGTVSSYASLVNPDEGTSLKFVETPMINGVKFAKIDTEDVIPEIKLLMEIPVDGAFPRFIDFINDEEVVVRLQVEYEWNPIKCHYCRMYGHKEEECMKKTNVRKEWRKVPTQPDQEREIA
ncbi:hypothetical protein Cgig2_019165 [Carnegiea gigantea]|uniref:Zinc knuckle CX2CX4HX4C domain-containing protein n=1 Tax=Carnegiea gigantea TaxID=171969 RepID=A0A9Q1JEI3_9CARY|nr:hypothetical protein Cgig2_019165 [Carnegiea gigantea]